MTKPLRVGSGYRVLRVPEGWAVVEITTEIGKRGSAVREHETVATVPTEQDAEREIKRLMGEGEEE